MPPITTESMLATNRRDVPEAAVSNRSKTVALFDHLVGGREQLVRHGEAEHPGGRDIDG